MKQNAYNAYLEQYNNVRQDVDWGNRFRIIIRQLNRPVSAISHIIGCSDSEIIRIINGKRNPSYPLLIELARDFHVNCNWLFGQENSYEEENILIDKRRSRDAENLIAKRVINAQTAVGLSDAVFLRTTGLNYRTFAKIRRSSKDNSTSVDGTAAESNQITLNQRGINESTIYRIADSLSVGFEWLLCNDEMSRDFPYNYKMQEFLWNNQAIRETIWQKMLDAKERSDGNTNIIRETGIDNITLFEQTIGERIHNIRLENDLSVSQLSDLSGISKSAIWSWERGAFCPDPLSIKRLALSLNVGIDWLRIGDVGKKYYPCDYRMIEFLKEHPEIRKNIVQEMKASE